MAYAINQDVIDRLGTALAAQLTTPASSTVPDQNQITIAREGAEGLINSYLARRYATPVDITLDAGAAALLKAATIDVAEFRLRERRPPVPDDVTQRFDRTVEWLREIAEGKANMPSAVELPGPTSEGPVGQAQGDPRVFTRDQLKGL